MVATSLVAPGSTLGQVSPAPPRTVTVKSGDTLEGIAQRYGVSVAELKRVNSLKDADLLQVGQTLRLPVPPRKGVVAVKSGDTLESIAKAHQTTVAALQKANPGVQPNNLKVGSTLRLPSAAGHSTPAAKGSAPVAKGAAPAAKAPAPAVKTPTPAPTPAPETAPATTSAAPRPPLAADTPLSPERTESPSRGRWRYYGDTVVDWGGWKRLPDGVRYTLVQAAAKDVGEARAQATAIAVDCSTLRHNWRVKEAWEAWSIPAPRSVGQQIVLDLCGNAAGDERRPVPAPPSPSP
jgi:LysM repeat protein